MMEQPLPTVAIPCGHDVPFAECFFCDLSAKDIRYAKLFNRSIQEATPEQKKQLARWNQIRIPCKHLGAVLVESKNCGCPKVFDCALKGRVVKIGTHHLEPGLPQCFECEEYQAP